MTAVPATLLSALQAAAERWPLAALVFPADNESTSRAAFEAACRCVATHLHAQGVRPGMAVGLLCPNSLAFLLLFFGALHLGAVPVALPLPPSANDHPVYLSRLDHILADLGEVSVVVHGRYADLALRRLPGRSVLFWSDTWKQQPGEPLPAAAPADPAFIQYTSGSTSAPKGVALSHANLLAGVQAISEGMQLTADDRASIWLPLFHDMGFVAVLAGLLAGTPLFVWTPQSFLRRPERWLQHFAQQRCTVSIGPNFSFDYLVDGVDEAACVGLDLSHWRVAFSGGEQVEVATLERFASRFGPHGFDAAALFPVYGLAEATLACTFPPLGRLPRWQSFLAASLLRGCQVLPLAAGRPGVRRLVSVGRAVRGHDVCVTDGDGRCLPDGTVGGIRVRGPAVMSGYYRQPLATRQTMDGEWLLTGDLGFCLDGEIYICGREKEMIVVRGRNFYPFDAEAAVLGLRGVHRQRCNAVALCAGEDERIGVFIEVDDADPGALRMLGGQAVDAVKGELEFSAFEVHLVRRGTLKRTSSGKYRRAALADEHQRGGLQQDILASFRP